MLFRLLCAVLLTLAARPGLGLASSAPSGANPSCATAKEFITTLEFLRQDATFKVPEPQARKVATQVAQGCTGAAQRFIRVAKVLNTSGLGGKDSVEEALTFAARTDAVTDTFIVVFRQAFLGEYLDLDLRASIQLARSLSTSFEGDVLGARDDFARLVEFCVSPGKLDLARPLCAGFAAETARMGTAPAWGSGGIAEPFIRLYEFLRTDPTGPTLATSAALELTREVLARGPDSADSFITGYRYAAAKKGLDLGRGEAVSFARQLAGPPSGPSGPSVTKPETSKRK